MPHQGKDKLVMAKVHGVSGNASVIAEVASATEDHGVVGSAPSAKSAVETRD